METGKAHRTDGFTLIEVITVVAIILLLATILVAAGKGMITRSLTKSAEAQITAINAALNSYCNDHRTYPQNMQADDLFPSDADDEQKDAYPKLPLSAISGQYITSSEVDYYIAKTQELDLNLDGVLDEDDQSNGEYFILDPWGFPLYYYVKSVTCDLPGGGSFEVFFGAVNKSGCDLASKGPDGILNTPVGNSSTQKFGDDITNW